MVGSSSWNFTIILPTGNFLALTTLRRLCRESLSLLITHIVAFAKPWLISSAKLGATNVSHLALFTQEENSQKSAYSRDRIELLRSEIFIRIIFISLSDKYFMMIADVNVIVKPIFEIFSK